MATLKEDIQKALNLPESHFSNHESDLYVKYSIPLIEWLQLNYEFYLNCNPFKSQLDDELWLEIPFGYIDEHFSQRFPNTIKRINVPINITANLN